MIKISLILILLSVVSVSAQTCNSTEDCSNNGLCSNNQCYCFSEYITHESIIGCNYHQKSRLTAFMLELFLACCVAPYYKTLRKEHYADDTLKMGCTMCLYLLILLTVLGFWLHGVIVMGMGTAKDSNGVSIGDW